ncbi:MAG: hypothetical protein PVG51_13785, partial [Desulfosarcina sp.]
MFINIDGLAKQKKPGIVPAFRTCHLFQLRIEEPRSELRGIVDRKEFCLLFDSLAYPAASDGECARCRG